MIDKTELEKILDRVESITTTGDDANKLRALYKHHYELVDSAAVFANRTGNLIDSVLSKQEVPPGDVEK